MDGCSPNEFFFLHDVEKRRIIILSFSSFPFMCHEHVSVTSPLAWQVLRFFSLLLFFLPLFDNWFMLLAVHYRVMEHLGSLESTKEA